MRRRRGQGVNRAERRSKGQRGHRPPDTRIVYGARCSWWDSIDKVSTIETPSGHGLPCCPNCQSPLYEVPSEAEWFAGVNEHATKEPGYREFIEWARGKCFPNFDVAKTAYAESQT